MTLTSTITQDTLPSAFAAPPWSETRALSLRDQPRDAGFLRTLFAQPAMAHLEQLDLPGVAVGRDGAEALAGATLPSLRVLTLSDSALGDAGAQALAKATQLTALKVVNLRANDIDDAGAEALLHAPQLSGLERLDLSDNPISSAMKARFREHFGDRVKI